MMLRHRVVGLSIWLVIAAIAGAFGWLIFDANFSIVAGFTLVGLVGNALIIEWEDNQPGGWGNP
jgi:hypothetical protein